MSSRVSWQLLLLLCATSVGELLAEMAPVENPRSIGPRRGALALLAPWGQGLQCSERKQVPAGPRPRGASLCPPGQSSRENPRPGLCAPRGHRIPAVLVQREKDLSAFNWNSFGLRYGKRRAVRGSHGGDGARG